MAYVTGNAKRYSLTEAGARKYLKEVTDLDPACIDAATVTPDTCVTGAFMFQGLGEGDTPDLQVFLGPKGYSNSHVKSVGWNMVRPG
jgi:hypothetical protein